MELIRGIDTSKGRQATVAGVLHSARILDLRVVAEDVENVEERDYLKSSVIGLMQGYLCCKTAFELLGKISPESWGN